MIENSECLFIAMRSWWDNADSEITTIVNFNCNDEKWAGIDKIGELFLIISLSDVLHYRLYLVADFSKFYGKVKQSHTVL